MAIIDIIKRKPDAPLIDQLYAKSGELEFTADSKAAEAASLAELAAQAKQEAATAVEQVLAVDQAIAILQAAGVTL